MKIAIPTDGETVEDHFGHCEMYTIFTIGTDKQIEKTEILPSPQGCGCKSDIAGTLNKLGVDVMLAGNMGQGALNTLNYYGIDVYRGNSGKIDDLVSEFLKGNINDSGKSCGHHEQHGEGHQCEHNHEA
jgi:predicted Fe-Mo cluster-binding NifX family protein